VTETPSRALAATVRRGAPARRVVVRAVLCGTVAQLAGIALVGGATGLLTWSSARPGIASVVGLLVAVEVVAFLRAPLRHAERVAAHDLGLDGLSGWRTWLLESIATWSPSRIAAARTGDLLARCLEDTDQLQDLWVSVLVPAASSVIALLAASVLLAIAVPVVGAGLAVATVLVVAVTARRARRVVGLGVEEARLRGSVAARVVEYTRAASALASLGASARHAATTTSLADRADQLALRRGASASTIGVLAGFAGGAALFVAVAAVQLPTSHPGLAAGVVLATLACTELLVGIPTVLDSLGAVAGAAERLGTLAEPVADGGAPARRGDLELRDVDVTAFAEGAVLLHGVSLVAAPNSSVSVLGPSASGKSSLLAAASRLEQTAGGRITLDGSDVDELEEASLREHVAWLSATPTLLEGRVRDVLDVGRGIDEAALVAAIEGVGLTDVLGVRGGLDAVIGPRAMDLSGGERRRLALARLLAGQPDYLVLDEPTAGLDRDAVRVVLAALDDTRAAVLVATHDDQVAAWSASARSVEDWSVDD
jgi:ABC-type transport system involved in cytochrome bd biosynthesis fused ATPase/permease subunit